MQSVRDEEKFEEGEIAIPFLLRDLRKARPYETLRDMYFHIVLRELSHLAHPEYRDSGIKIRKTLGDLYSQR
jgi:hypothetical protein